MDNINFDENTLNKLKDMMNKGELNDVMQNFSSMMNNSTYSNQSQPQDQTQGQKNANNFDFSNIDMNTIMKMKSVMEKMNNSNDPRSNLLYSLKPYLREGKKEKLDQYANLLNVAKIADIFKDSNKENQQ